MDRQKKHEKRNFRSGGLKKGHTANTRRQKRASKRSSKMFRWNEVIQEMFEEEK